MISNLTRAQAQNAFLKGHKISHIYFLHSEFIQLNADKKMEDEDGNILNKMDFWLAHGSSRFDTGWHVFT